MAYLKTTGGGLDFSGSDALYAKNPNANLIVSIKYTDYYTKDFEAANKAAGLNQKTTPNQYVWHHLDDYSPATKQDTVQLVEKQAHNGIPHKGAVSQFKTAAGKSSTFETCNNSSKKIGGSTC